MSDKKWATAITRIDKGEIDLRGYPIAELMGNISFAQGIILALTGELPDQRRARLLEAMLVSSIDHGVTPPSCLASRTAASTGASLNAALAAGILSINDYHGGAIHNCMLILEETMTFCRTAEKSIAEAAMNTVSQYRQLGKRINGFGHRVHHNDPRKVRLFALATELKLAGEYSQLALAMEKALADALGKEMPLNVDGAIAALLCDLDYPVALANAFFIIARVPGLIAHIDEEKSREKVMRRIDTGLHTYDGPGRRQLAQGEENV
jgi:citrate synthase